GRVTMQDVIERFDLQGTADEYGDLDTFTFTPEHSTTGYPYYDFAWDQSKNGWRVAVTSIQLMESLDEEPQPVTYHPDITVAYDERGGFLEAVDLAFRAGRRQEVRRFLTTSN